MIKTLKPLRNFTTNWHPYIPCPRVPQTATSENKFFFFEKKLINLTKTIQMNYFSSCLTTSNLTPSSIGPSHINIHPINSMPNMTLRHNSEQPELLPNYSLGSDFQNINNTLSYAVEVEISQNSAIPESIQFNYGTKINVNQPYNLLASNLNSYNQNLNVNSTNDCHAHTVHSLIAL